MVVHVNKITYVQGYNCLGDEERQDHLHHVQLAQTFFPSSICAVVLPIIHLLDDGEVNDNGVAGILENCYLLTKRQIFGLDQTQSNCRQQI